MKIIISSILLFSILLSCVTKEITKETITTTAAVTGLERLITQAKYEELFPNRANLNTTYNGSDFYSYQSFAEAVAELSTVKLELINRENPAADIPKFGEYVTYTYKLRSTNSATGVVTNLVVGDEYNESWNLVKPEIVRSTINFGDFINSGVLAKDKKELAAFLANISHETTGGGNADATKTKGLWYKEELAYAPLAPGKTINDYTAASNTTFPPVSGKSYHGRGPIQLSWNYNYGLSSFITYGDKDVLLKNPERVLTSGKEAFMTAIVFWMTPVEKKPSCHNVFNSDRGFGKTINIINGGLECRGVPGPASTDYRVLDRIGFYRRYMTQLGLSTSESDFDLSCEGMTDY